MEYKQVYDDGTIKLSRSEHGWHLWSRPAVATLLVRDGKITVIYEKKDSTGRWIWNCPSGMIEPGENSEQAAARECEEEVGIIPTKLDKFATVQTDFPDTFVDFYIGSNLQPGQKANWVTEEIGKIQEKSWDEIYRMAADCEFHDPRLIVAILKLSKQTELLKSHNLI